MDNLTKVIIYSSLAGSTILVGGYLGTKDISERLLSFMLSFGAGILLSVISFSLIPESYRGAGMLGSSGSFILGGIFFLVIDDFIEKRFSSGVGIALGTFLDDLPEAISMGIGFATGGGGLGTVLAVSVFLHNIPEGFLTTEEMINEGNFKKRFAYLIAGIIALINPIGAIIGFKFLVGLSKFWLGSIMAFAGGAILYMITDEMIPRAVSNGGKFEVMGVLIGFLSSFLLGEIFTAGSLAF
ncbi:MULTISPECIES: ZIP family metal transporter [unclassified Candidatus Frackibacter]|uniref:ZIP family metal transporter n=1 Tax=unclassified Candidatus Frackibacter TaxID=2648818 RepID=UPI0007950B0F|nr:MULTISPECIES: ZIP family metal transporter [unclassified Candidatus Frackibacter]KXS43677.1 MAG: zinc transporter, ZIP family [Candidatus Frackibacter sp. T328-2]SDC01706.1 zinc transporter, ZIP family [Candidatus Frackibacter sp. WG11]SEM32924.1 zinc transporter, ZIP family [Candidatus Frackibacter sp. WG12]SFL37903.1 zinc transporter, ZIP family [Candidatus Frackibacter sp. WG13]